jgi:tRNA pseudouridine55 synthase
MIPAAEALTDWPAIELIDDQMDAIRHGHRIPAVEGSGPKACGISEQGELVALLVLDPDKMEWQPKKVFFS